VNLHQEVASVPLPQHSMRKNKNSTGS